MYSPTPTAVIHHLAAVLNSDEVDAGLAKLLAPEVVYNEHWLSARDVIGVLGPLQGAVPDLRWCLNRLVAEGDWVTSLWTMTGTHQADFVHPVLGRFAATGEGIRLIYSLFCRIDSGRIVELLDVSDRLALFQQLSVLPVLGLGEGTHTVPALVRQTESFRPG